MCLSWQSSESWVVCNLSRTFLQHCDCLGAILSSHTLSLHAHTMWPAARASRRAMAISSCHCGIIAYTSATSHMYAGCTSLQALG